MSNRLVKKEPEKEEKYGIKFYSYAGKIFIGCGILWFFLTKYITTMPQDFEKYNVYLFFALCYIFSAIQILLGIVLLYLSKKSKRFRKWANSDVKKAMHKIFIKELREYEKREEKEDHMTNLDMQNLNRATMKHLIKNIEVGMPLTEVRSICEKFMLENGADSFWYWNVGAFVFSGDETTVSVSGKVYQTSERAIGNDDIITVDLSPQNHNMWGDYARTIIIEDGKVIEDEDIHNSEWKQGLQMEQRLHKLLIENATTDMTFEELYYYMNDIISKHGFLNLDFAGNLGHSIVENKDDRIYIEKGNKAKLSEVKMFTFEPHISIPDSKYGYKREDIYYFEKGQLVKL